MRLMRLSAFLRRWIFSTDGRWHRLAQAVAEQEGWIWAMPRPSPPWPVIVRDSSAPHAGSAWIF